MNAKVARQDVLDLVLNKQAETPSDERAVVKRSLDELREKFTGLSDEQFQRLGQRAARRIA
jgi:tetrahydromethanopterin S-methyltransferase subunit G